LNGGKNNIFASLDSTYVEKVREAAINFGRLPPETFNEIDQAVRSAKVASSVLYSQDTLCCFGVTHTISNDTDEVFVAFDRHAVEWLFKKGFIKNPCSVRVSPKEEATLPILLHCVKTYDLDVPLSKINLISR